MTDILKKLKKEICQTLPVREVEQSIYKNFIDNTVVALMAGGESSRFQEVSGANSTNKNAYKLPNGDTMIEMTLRMYAQAGIKNFVCLVYHKAQTIQEVLGDGSKYDVNIKYSYDPDQPVGKGGAVLNALLNGSIQSNKNLIVHNPDDVIINFSGNFPKHIISGHINNTIAGAIASIVVVNEMPYAYTGMTIADNLITGIEMYPMIPIPTHIGVTIFSPKSYDYFHQLFDLTKKSDFEQVLFPILCNDKKLYAVSIPTANWIAVNNLKAYNALLKSLNL